VRECNVAETTLFRSKIRLRGGEGLVSVGVDAEVAIDEADTDAEPDVDVDDEELEVELDNVRDKELGSPANAVVTLGDDNDPSVRE